MTSKIILINIMLQTFSLKPVPSKGFRVLKLIVTDVGPHSISGSPYISF